jgi:hypothetical protein
MCTGGPGAPDAARLTEAARQSVSRERSDFHVPRTIALRSGDRDQADGSGSAGGADEPSVEDTPASTA